MLTGGDDGEAISRGVYDAYTQAEPALLPARAADHVGREEHRHQPAGPDRDLLHARTATDPAYKFLFMAKGGGSANKSFLYQETKAVLNPTRMLTFLDEKIRSLGTAACPPYHLAVVIGGTSAEFALKTAKYASAQVPRRRCRPRARPTAHGFRDLELEAEVLELTRGFGIGAQFGGKYFCHDVRVVRLPRHGASCPVAIAVSCSADRQALGKITAEGVFLEQLETDPARFLPETDRRAPRRRRPTWCTIDLNRPMAEIRAELSQVPGQDPALADRPAGRGARHRAREDQGAARRRRADAGVPARPRRLLRRPGQDARGLRVRARSARPPPAGWTPTSSSSRRRAARSSCWPRATGRPR